VSAARLLAALKAARISHLVVVPDTVQKISLAAAAEDPGITMVPACTEDEAIGINAGLYVTGHRPALSIQNNGVYACLNALRGIALDGEVPTFMLVGQYGGRAEVPPEESPLRMVRKLEPTLTAWDIPFRRLTSDADLAGLAEAYEEAFDRRGPAAFIIPIPTVA
jgi:sulfopyruvate decarboxylase subunit alpha